MPTYECPICSEEKLVESGPSAYKCQHCRASILDGKLVCSACGKQNPLEAAKCETCQEPLTIFSRVVSRHSKSTRSWRLDQARDQANTLKAAEADASEVRMEVFLEIDRKRKTAEREAALMQEEADRQLFHYVRIGLGIFLAIVAVASLIIALV
ncbi:MAG: hypothetical protein E3J69_07690 [Anaerolineales bacterium]|nr:MAG: hypothetical protein E3J69_07690 [Anaerolineales bacterium]